jgi:CUB domain
MSAAASIEHSWLSFGKCCIWNFFAKLSFAQFVTLSFSDFYTESYSDYVYIYNGYNTSSSLLATLSGSYYSSTSYTTTQRYMFVMFSSNGYSTYSGFRASYQIVYPSGVIVVVFCCDRTKYTFQVHALVYNSPDNCCYIAKQVTAVEDCDGKSVRLYDGWRVDYATGWLKLPHVGFPQFARARLEAASAV